MNELCYINNKKSLFRKYKYLVTAFAKSDIGGDYIQSMIPFFKKSKELELFLPNGYVEKRDDLYKGIFTTRPIFSPLLLHSLTKIDIARTYYKDLTFQDCLRMLYIDLGLVKNSFDLPQVLLGTYPFTPDYNPESTSVDGVVGQGVGNTAWATLRAGAGNQTNGESDATGLAFTITNADGSNPNFTYLYRGIFLFDTSALTSNSTLQSGQNKFKLYVNSKTDDFSQSCSLALSNPASNTALANTDFANSHWTFTRQATDVTIASITASQYFEMTLNTTGDSNVSKTGITKFGTICSGDMDNSAPAWQAATTASNLNVNYADNITNPPTLTILTQPPKVGSMLQMLQ